MSIGSPWPESSIDGTVASGARSEKAESVRCKPGQRVPGSRGGEDEGMRVEEVGTGVGYERSLNAFDGDAWAKRLIDRGNCGDDEGSKAGSREGAGRFTPATGETGRGTWLGEERILLLCLCSCKDARKIPPLILGSGWLHTYQRASRHDRLRAQAIRLRYGKGCQYEN